MSLFTKLFGGGREAPKGLLFESLGVDMHSHLLPGIDDGAQNPEETLSLVRALVERGIRKFIVTPHIIAEVYPNTAETIGAALTTARQTLAEAGLEVSIEAAAEHYLDEHLMARLDGQEPLMSFGGGSRYVLFETAFLNEPVYLRDAAFKMLASGYQPVLAHPERYLYLWERPEKVTDLIDAGVLLQVNMLSLAGHYGKPQQIMAERLIEQGQVHFLGTDCHRQAHIQVMEQLSQSRAYKRALELPLLNRSL